MTAILRLAKRGEGHLLVVLNAEKRITHLTYYRAYAVGANTILTRMINTMTDCYNTSNEQPHPHEECDQTPFECPCFTRGGDKTLQLAMHHITEILDGKDDGIGVNREPWHTVRQRLLSLVNNELTDFIEENMEEVNTKLPQLTHDDPHSFACGYNSGYKSCLLSIARRMGFTETQIKAM